MSRIAPVPSSRPTPHVRKPSDSIGRLDRLREEQMGHSSIQVTVDTYGHLMRGADIAWVGRLDAVAQTSANNSQTLTEVQGPRSAANC
jgi:hypothetical protein